MNAFDDGLDDGVDSTDDGGRRPRTTRRRVLSLGGAAGLTALAGCTVPGLGGSETGPVSLGDFRGSGPLVSGRPEPEGTHIADLPDLSGTLDLYLGGGEGGLYLDLIRLFERYYDDFEVEHDIQDSSDLVNRIQEEQAADSIQADVFIAVDAGSLGAVAAAGATETLPDAALEPVPEQFTDGQGRWVGVAGRARSVPYNTNELSADEIPDSVHDFPETAALANEVGWAPTYSAFQGFITAMRLNRNDEVATEWLNAMQDHGVTEYRDEWFTSNAVADGSVSAGFANHYYALRVQNQRPDAPIDIAFTEGDAGALVNVSGASILSGTDRSEVAGNFVRHLLSAEAQEFFATRTFAYPMIPGVAPVGGLPTINELNPPDIDLTELADVAGTVDLMREAGVL